MTSPSTSLPSRCSTPLPAPETLVGLGLGCNLGDAPGNIARALRLVEERGAARVEKISRVYRTPPWGPVAQPDFANACALARTKLAPQRLLAALKGIEADMGRQAGERWGPRLIDLDILFYGDVRLDEPGLTIPHKHLFDRAFVLIPLAEIAPDLRIAGRLVGAAARALDAADMEIWPARD